MSWRNGDDVPHQIVSVGGRFKASPVLDTSRRYALRLPARGTYADYCSLHPQMTERIVVA